MVHGGVLWRFWDAVPLRTPPSMMHCWYEPNEPVLWCYAVHGCTAVATVGRSGGRRSCGGDVSQGTASVRCGWPCVRGRQIRCCARRWFVVRSGPGDGCGHARGRQRGLIAGRSGPVCGARSARPATAPICPSAWRAVVGPPTLSVCDRIGRSRHTEALQIRRSMLLAEGRSVAGVPRTHPLLLAPTPARDGM